jgi:Beta-propeller repeat
MNQIELSDDTGAAALMDALFSHLFGKSKRTPRRGYRPGMERLEDRLSPAAGLAASNSQLLADYGQLPLSFEANEGQTAAQVRFLTQANGGTLFLTSSGAVLSLTKPVGQTFLSANPAIPESGQTGMSAPPNATDGIALALDLVGANPNAAVVGLDPLPGISNYFIGNDPSQWHTNIPNYSKVEYQNVYAGINLVYYGNQQQLEYEYQLAPGADPSQIRFAVQGAERLSIDAKGDLVLHTAIGDVLEHAPVIYQEIAGVQKRVSGQFVLLGNNEVGFQVGSYDATLPLVIDPVLSYSTYLGGNNFDGANGIAVDGSGDAYVIGSTKSANFPITTGAFQTSYGGSGNFEAFVTKLNASGTGLVYSTYLGGNNGDDGYGIAVDASGNAYVTGETSSANFPTIPGAFQTSYGGGGDAFVTKLNASGTGLVYSTYLGGSSGDNGYGIAVDGSGNAYVTGYTGSNNFPTTPGAFQTSYGGGPYDAFVTKLNATGTALVYSTYLGGNDSDYGMGIALDSSGNAYVAGETKSTNFPTTADAFQSSYGGGATYDAFVTKLNASGTGLVYSTYLGGNSLDYGRAIAVDGSGNVYVAGETSSNNFPTTTGAFQTSYGGGGEPDGFVAKFSFPPAISSVVINQDISALYNAAGQPSPGVQRSMVDDIVYTFSEPVNILDPGTDPNVFTVAVASGWTGTVPTLGWTAVAGSNGTQWAVTFSGNGVTGGSIANGAYTITVNDPASITAASDDQELSLDASGIGGATQSFYRLFGDINGDEVVNAADNIQFKQALTAYNVAFDYNDDGVVNATDNLQFKNDLSVNYSGFTATI